MQATPAHRLQIVAYRGSSIRPEYFGNGVVWIRRKQITHASSKTVFSRYLAPSSSESAAPVFSDENIQEEPEIYTYMLNLPVV